MRTEEDVIEYNADEDPSRLAPWYDQFLKLDESKRQEIVQKAMRRIEAAKPDTFKFIKKFSCQLVGISPRVEYAILKPSEGDLDITYVHSYSMPTLLFWCDEGKFHFSVNANLDYNDTVLNRLKGNKKDRSIKGFTA